MTYDAGRKGLEANMIACPAWVLEGCSFAAATGAACAGTQFIAGGVRPPQDDRDSASQRRAMLATLTP